jgi:hypothetical protein
MIWNRIVHPVRTHAPRKQALLHGAWPLLLRHSRNGGVSKRRSTLFFDHFSELWLPTGEKLGRHSDSVGELWKAKDQSQKVSSSHSYTWYRVGTLVAFKSLSGGVLNVLFGNVNGLILGPAPTWLFDSCYGNITAESVIWSFTWGIKSSTLRQAFA